MTFENYSERRDALVAEENTARLPKLNEKELAVDKKLSQWKREYADACGGHIPYTVPVLTDERIWNSRLYRFCTELPKGADLHLHGNTILSAPDMIRFIRSRSDVALSLCDGAKRATLKYIGQEPAPEGYMTLEDALTAGAFTEEELCSLWSVTGWGHDEEIWAWFEKLFDRHIPLGDSVEVLEAYYERAFTTLWENGISHVEVKQLLFGDHAAAEATAKAVREAYYAVRREHPEFIASIVGSGLKYTFLPITITEMLLDNAMYCRETVKDEFDPDYVTDFVVGLDLLNEEDKSRPLPEFIPLLEKLFAQYGEAPLFLHAGESLYADSANLYDAYLLGSRRIGHGLNLYRYPALLKRFVDEEICIEVCPISNQTLLYCTDVRQHPAVEYMRRGVKRVLASDDPAYQEHRILTDDFFAAVVCWGFGIAELKELCRNSIRFSGLDEKRKAELMTAWEAQWNAFIEHNAE